MARIKTAFPDNLKNSILQQAIEGKLVPQDPTDEPASVLLERIKQKRQQLILNGKIKASKPPKSNEPILPPHYRNVLSMVLILLFYLQYVSVPIMEAEELKIL